MHTGEGTNEQDWDKLTRMLQYLKDTIDLQLILSADSIQAMHTWVDASYAVHHNMRSHIGVAYPWDVVWYTANPRSKN